MNSREFAKNTEARVAKFCKSLDDKLPAYSYIPLTTDEMRVKVMQFIVQALAELGHPSLGFLCKLTAIHTKLRSR